MGKFISLIIVPHDNTKTWNLRFSYKLLYLLATVAIIAFVLTIGFLFKYSVVLVRAEQAIRFQQENTELKLQAAQIDSLRLELVNLQAMGLQLKGMLGVDLTPHDSLLVARLSPVVGTPTIGGDAYEEAVGADEQRKMLEAMPSLSPVKGFVSKTFYITGGEKAEEYHPGIDIAAPRNTPIRAAADGVIVASEFDDTYGYMVEIDHGYGLVTLYGHNARNLVNVGDRVSRGKTIAFVGSTGNSSAPHVHFEVRKNGVPVDPSKYLLN